MSINTTTTAAFFADLQVVGEFLVQGYETDLIALGEAICAQTLSEYTHISLWRRNTQEVQAQAPADAPVAVPDVAAAAGAEPLTCTAKTKKNVRCKKRALAGTDKCKIHATAVAAAPLEEVITLVESSQEITPAAEPSKCIARTLKDSPCKNRALAGSDRCKRHAGWVAPAEVNLKVVTFATPTRDAEEPLHQEEKESKGYCVARTLKDTPCRNRALVGSDRCKRHAPAQVQEVKQDGDMCMGKNKGNAPCKARALPHGLYCTRHFKLMGETPSVLIDPINILCAFERIEGRSAPSGSLGLLHDSVTTDCNWVELDFKIEGLDMTELHIYSLDKTYHLALIEDQGRLRAYVRSMESCFFPIYILARGFEQLYLLQGERRLVDRALVCKAGEDCLLVELPAQE